MMMQCIAIASGHRVTHVLATRDDGKVFFTEGDSLNLHNFSHNLVIGKLREILVDLARELDHESIESLLDTTERIVLSLPGISTVPDRELGAYCLRAVGWQNPATMRIVDDTWSGLVGGLLSEQGVCAFAGSGASVFFGHTGFTLGKPYKLDGLGVVIGDFGSGFRTAVRLIELVGREYDAGCKHPLADHVFSMEQKWLACEDDIQTWFDRLMTRSLDGDWRRRIAELASIATVYAEPPHQVPEAIELVTNAASEIAETILIGLKRFSPACDKMPITLQGGMFRFSPLYRREVIRVLSESATNPVALGRYSPVVGALLMAHAGAEEKPDPVYAISFRRSLPSKKVMRQVLSSISDMPPEIQGHLILEGGG